MLKQRLLGIGIIVLCIMIYIFASQGTTPVDRDITPVLFLLPIGIQSLVTIRSGTAGASTGMHQEDGDSAADKSRKGSMKNVKKTHEGRAGAASIGRRGRSAQGDCGA